MFIQKENSVDVRHIQNSDTVAYNQGVFQKLVWKTWKSHANIAESPQSRTN